jgi:hypothetical protein
VGEGAPAFLAPLFHSTRRRKDPLNGVVTAGVSAGVVVASDDAVNDGSVARMQVRTIVGPTGYC